MSRSLKEQETSYPSLFYETNQTPKNEAWHTAPYLTQPQLPLMPHYIPSFFQPSTQSSPDQKYPDLIHIQPRLPGQVYVPYGHSASRSPSPSTTRCSSSTLALSDDDPRKIFSSCPPGPDPIMTPIPVCEHREQLMTREVLMMSPHTYSYAAPFYPINQSCDRNDENQGPEVPCTARPPPPPLEVAPYRSSKRVWQKNFMDGLGAPDLPIMGFYARRLVHSDCVWDEDELMHLSRTFVWQASERGEKSSALLAAFAAEVCRVFHVAPWAGTAESFRNCLWNVIRETFAASWHFNEHQPSRRAVVYIKDPSPKYKEYVVSALALCKLIAELFKYDFIARPHIVGCVRILIHNLTTVEHVMAIDNIIKHTGVYLWRGAMNLDTEVKDFRMVLMEKSQPLKDFRTVLLKVNTKGNVGVRSKIDEILTFVENCRLAVVKERQMPVAT